MDPIIPPPRIAATGMTSRRVVIALGGLSALLIVVFVTYLILSLSRGSKPTLSVPKTASTNIATPPFPKLDVSSWTVLESATPHVATTTARIYTLHSKFGRTEFSELLPHFFDTHDITEREKSIDAQTDGGQSVLYMHKTGSFIYRSMTGLPLATNTNEREEVTRYINSMYDDTTLRVFATYEKRSDPGVLFYELRRDWKLFGLPIYNLYGILNVPASTRLDAQTEGARDASFAPDTNIINTSDHTDGYKRPDDFNTVSVGVKKGSITAVVSNLRRLERSYEVPASELIPYDEAVKRLKNNGYSRLYTSPANRDPVDASRLYPDNHAVLTGAIVNDSVVSYLEELPGHDQDVYAPYYVFRGESQLSSGYRVTFVATVLASSKRVLGAYTAFDSSQKQGILVMDARVGTRSASLHTATQSASLAYTLKPCTTQPTGQSQLYNLHSDLIGTIYGQYNTHWYLVPIQTPDINQLSRHVDTYLHDVQKPTSLNAPQAWTALVTSWDKQPQLQCPVRLSGR